MDTVADILSLSFDPRLAGHAELEAERAKAARLAETLHWKSGLPPQFPLVACLLGGTGTGKSMLFNSLAGRPISEVGTLRPCTLKAVILVGENWMAQIMGSPCFSQDSEAATVVTHQDRELEHLILVDTPDFDSVEAANREICESFFILSDVVIFVTSQEKYADLAGIEVVERARTWGKKTVFVMNKASSDEAFNDFAEMLRIRENDLSLVRVERVESATTYVPGLTQRPEFRDLISLGKGGSRCEQIRIQEVRGLTRSALASVEDLDNSIDKHRRRIQSVNGKIEEILKAVSKEMDNQLEVILSQEMEEHISGRLRELFRKYDILFVPRMVVRNALSTLYSALLEMLPFSAGAAADQRSEKSYRIEDLDQARSSARLEPLEHAIAQLNLQVAELLATGSNAEDLREVARQSVPRWDKHDIRSLYDKAFPGVERLLEAEFERFRHGLSAVDELKLYGSYTAWALFLITAEIILGGGFTLLDAVLNTIIMPFIPKWLVNMKVIDVLKEIGEQVDRTHRNVLRGIVTDQARLYTAEFSGLLPSDDALARLHSLRLNLANRLSP